MLGRAPNTIRDYSSAPTFSTCLCCAFSGCFTLGTLLASGKKHSRWASLRLIALGSWNGMIYLRECRWCATRINWYVINIYWSNAIYSNAITISGHFNRPFFKSMKFMENIDEVAIVPSMILLIKLGFKRVPYTPNRPLRPWHITLRHFIISIINDDSSSSTSASTEHFYIYEYIPNHANIYPMKFSVRKIVLSPMQLCAAPKTKFIESTIINFHFVCFMMSRASVNTRDVFVFRAAHIAMMWYNLF